MSTRPRMTYKIIIKLVADKDAKSTERKDKTDQVHSGRYVAG